MPKHLLYHPVFFSHLVLVVISWAAPLWCDWRFIILGVLLLRAQQIFFGGCVITFWEMGKKERGVTFYYLHLSPFFPRLSKRACRIFAWYVLPLCLIVAAYVLQERYAFEPLLLIWPL